MSYLGGDHWEENGVPIPIPPEYKDARAILDFARGLDRAVEALERPLGGRVRGIALDDLFDRIEVLERHLARLKAYARRREQESLDTELAARRHTDRRVVP